MNTYLVTLEDLDTAEVQKIWVRSDCEHNMQEFVNGITDPPLTLKSPKVTEVHLWKSSILPDPAVA